VPTLAIKQDRDWRFRLHHPPIAACASDAQRSRGHGAQRYYGGRARPQLRASSTRYLRRSRNGSNVSVWRREWNARSLISAPLMARPNPVGHVISPRGNPKPSQFTPGGAQRSNHRLTTEHRERTAIAASGHCPAACRRAYLASTVGAAQLLSARGVMAAEGQTVSMRVCA
jgi:hypothetical protein